MSRVLIVFIQIYQKLISPFFPRSCRFYPTCSEYSILALRKHGFFKGGYLMIKRISKCHPFHPGGYDPL